MHEEAGSIRWAPRVPPALIRRLYERDAQGVQDDELLGDVGFRLFERCRDIVIASAAMNGNATCPRCDGRCPHDGSSKARLRCPCGWSMRWSAYERTFRDRRLWGGRAMPYFTAFLEAWKGARTPAARILAIDAVLHALHADVIDDDHGRPAVAWVIEASDADGRALLDELAGITR